jgi:hypothetical protein
MPDRKPADARSQRAPRCPLPFLRVEGRAFGHRFAAHAFFGMTRYPKGRGERAPSGKKHVPACPPIVPVPRAWVQRAL